MAESQSDNSAPTCCFPHDLNSGAPLLGLSYLTPHPNPRPMTELLPLRKGQKLHEDIAQAHPYAFNMGSSRVIPLQDYKEAADLLIKGTRQKSYMTNRIRLCPSQRHTCQKNPGWLICPKELVPFTQLVKVRRGQLVLALPNIRFS